MRRPSLPQTVPFQAELRQDPKDIYPRGQKKLAPVWQIPRVAQRKQNSFFGTIDPHSKDKKASFPPLRR